MRTLYPIAAAIAFLLELCALAALAYWGATAVGGPLAVILAVGLPLGAAVVWGTLAAPRASVRLADGPKTAVRLIVLLGSALALAVAGRQQMALVFALVVLVDIAVLAALGRPVAGA